MSNKRKWLPVVCAALALCAGCNKSPFERTRDDSGGGATGSFNSGGSFPVFSNELKTGGGAFLYPGGENQSLSFSDTSNSISARSIRYVWNGGDVSAPGCTPNPLHVFAGFDLMHTPLQSSYDTTDGRDLTQANYGHVKFYARGSLSANTVVIIEVASPGTAPGCVPPTPSPCLVLSANGSDTASGNPCVNVNSLTSSWRQYQITLAPSDLSDIKDFFKATFVHNLPATGPAGQGGTVYFDQIEYTP